MKRKNWVIIGLLVFGWVLFLGQPGIVATKLRMIFAQLSTPFVRLGDYIPTVRARRQLATENDTLRRQNAELRQQVANLGQQGAENLRLRQLLALKENVPGKTRGVRVIGRDASNWWRSIQLDCGSDDGFHPNMSVINPDGLVGKTVAVSRNESRVLLLIDPGCKASARLQTSREIGLVSVVDAAFSLNPQLQMTLVNRNAKVRIGEAVYTSGLGGVFPKGILIGTVTGSRINAESGMFQDIDVKPAVDFHRLEEVLVITE